jgi:hypothetical protein
VCRQTPSWRPAVEQHPVEGFAVDAIPVAGAVENRTPPFRPPLSFQPRNRLPDVLPAQLEAVTVGMGNHAELEVPLMPLRLVVVAQVAGFRAIFSSVCT